jgi:iron-sulfur cluster assembly protein
VEVFMNVNIDLKVTESAVKEFKRALAETDGTESVVRVSVQGGGCSGFMYGLGFVPESDINPEGDIVEEFDGLKVVVDKKSLMFLDGATIEWVDDLSQRGFKFVNPNAKKSCGCNKSFSC